MTFSKIVFVRRAESPVMPMRGGQKEAGLVSVSGKKN